MSEKHDAKITMVGLKQARVGFTFLHEGPLKECEECSLFEACMMNLEPKRVYKVVEVRDKIFPCTLHEEGVRVVGVVEPDLRAAIDNRYVFPQGIITYKPQECGEIACENYNTCVPVGLKAGDKGKIVEIIGPIQCPLHRSLVLVSLHRIEGEA